MKIKNLTILFSSLFLGACSTCFYCQNGVCTKQYSLFCDQPNPSEVKQTETIKAAPMEIKQQEPTIVVVEKQEAENDDVASVIIDNNIKYYVNEQNLSCISESSAIKAPLVDKNVQVDDDEYKAFENRVSAKDSKDGSGFHYRDVRVDEIMPLAARYCREHGNRTAILRKINLYHGYYRRISFDCVNL